MTIKASPKNSPPCLKPFTIQLHESEKSLSGSFRPEACLVLNQSFRSSGLLQKLPAEDLKSLLLLLTYLSPNGHCEAAIHQLCSAMRLSGLKVRRRMSRLTSFHWHGAQLVVEHKRESGLLAYVPHPALIEMETIPAYEPPTPPIKAVPREEVIAYSRQRYNTPRVIAEQLVEAQLRPASGLVRGRRCGYAPGRASKPVHPNGCAGSSESRKRCSPTQTRAGRAHYRASPATAAAFHSPSYRTATALAAIP